MNAKNTGKKIHHARVLAVVAALFAVLATGCATHNPGTLVPPPVSLPSGNR